MNKLIVVFLVVLPLQLYSNALYLEDHNFYYVSNDYFMMNGIGYSIDYNKILFEMSLGFSGDNNKFEWNYDAAVNSKGTESKFIGYLSTNVGFNLKTNKNIYIAALIGLSYESYFFDVKSVMGSSTRIEERIIGISPILRLYKILNNDIILGLTYSPIHLRKGDYRREQRKDTRINVNFRPGIFVGYSFN